MKVLLKGLLSVFKLNKHYALAMISLSILPVISAQAEIQLSGEIKQGGLVIGKTNANNLVKLNKKMLTVSTQGDYVFAFSRDDKTQYTLTVTSPTGKIETQTFTPTTRDYKISRVEGISKKIMNPNKKANVRAGEDRAAIVKVRKIASDLTDFSQGFIAPRSSRITGVYGSQRFYNGVPKNPHFGVD